MKQYYAQPSVRNDWERLHETYPEAKQMTYNQKGYDYLMENCHGLLLNITVWQNHTLHLQVVILRKLPNFPRRLLSKILPQI